MSLTGRAYDKALTKSIIAESKLSGPTAAGKRPPRIASNKKLTPQQHEEAAVNLKFNTSAVRVFDGIRHEQERAIELAEIDKKYKLRAINAQESIVKNVKKQHANASRKRKSTELSTKLSEVGLVLLKKKISAPSEKDELKPRDTSKAPIHRAPKNAPKIGTKGGIGVDDLEVLRSIDREGAARLVKKGKRAIESEFGAKIVVRGKTASSSDDDDSGGEGSDDDEGEGEADVTGAVDDEGNRVYTDQEEADFDARSAQDDHDRGKEERAYARGGSKEPWSSDSDDEDDAQPKKRRKVTKSRGSKAGLTALAAAAASLKKRGKSSLKTAKPALKKKKQKKQTQQEIDDEDSTDFVYLGKTLNQKEVDAAIEECKKQARAVRAARPPQSFRESHFKRLFKFCCRLQLEKSRKIEKNQRLAGTLSDVIGSLKDITKDSISDKDSPLFPDKIREPTAADLAL